MVDNKIIKILLAENVPSLNKGEMTILDGMLESFKLVGNTKVTMFSDFPEIDQPRYYPRLNVVDVSKWSCRDNTYGLRVIQGCFSSLVNIFKHAVFLFLYKIMGRNALKLMKTELWKNYADCDVIIIGHDNTFGILVGLTYGYYLYLPLFAKLLNKPIAFYGGSILKEQRPFWLWRNLLRFSLKNIDSITLRERITYERLKKNKLLNSRITVTGDPAFLLKPINQEEAIKILNQEEIPLGEKHLVGITLTRNCACEAFINLDNESSYNKHNRIIATAIDHIVTNYNAVVVFIPHCIGPGKTLDDRIIAKDILQQCQNKSKIRVVMNEYSASELKGIIGQCKLFIGERIHSTINALSMEVPGVVLVGKNDQRQDIVRMLGQDSAIYHLDNLDASTLIKKIDETYARLKQMEEELHTQVPTIQAKAMSNGTLLKELLNRNKID